MKKKNLLLLATSMLVLASCGAPAPSSSQATETSSHGTGLSSDSSSSLPPLYKEVDTNDFPSGVYCVRDDFYTYSKEEKKIVANEYTDYAAYKAKQGTETLNVSVKFVEFNSTYFGSNIKAVYFFDEATGIHYFIYKNGDIYQMDKVSIDGNSYSWGTTPLKVINENTFVEFSYGLYVSDELTQDKVDAEGKRIPNEDGGYVKENFYLFLELSEAKAAIYVSDNNKTHGETPLHSVENYKIRISGGTLLIDIPHKDGDFSCHLSSKSETQIKFNNSYEKHGDYSASGTFNKITDNLD